MNVIAGNLNKANLDSTESSYVKAADKTITDVELSINTQLEKFQNKISDIKNYYYKLYDLLDKIKEDYNSKETVVNQVNILQNAINNNNDNLSESVCDCSYDCDCDC